MNSSTSEALWPSPVAAHQTAQAPANTQNILSVAVASAIVTAVGSGLFTAAVTVSSSASADVQYVTALLNQGGYTCSNDGTHLNINW
jgi:hypothetical protein